MGILIALLPGCPAIFLISGNYKLYEFLTMSIGFGYLAHIIIFLQYKCQRGLKLQINPKLPKIKKFRDITERQKHEYWLLAVRISRKLLNF